MKITDIKVGQGYLAKVSGTLTTVRVLAIREVAASGRTRNVIDVVNERTGRKLTFRSAARLRRKVEREHIDAMIEWYALAENRGE